MKTTPEKLVELKAMAEHARSHFCIELAEAFVRAVPALIADLEEAQRRISISEAFAKELSSELITTRKQLAEAQARNAQVLSVAEKMRCAGGPQEFQYWFDELKSFLLRKQDASSLNAAIAEAIEPYRKDAERLDLLGKLCKETPLRPNAFCSEIAPDTRLRYEFPILVSYDSVGQQISLRDAIDAAIAAKGESECPS